MKKKLVVTEIERGWNGMVGDLRLHFVSGWWPKILIVRQIDVDAFTSTINPLRLQLQQIRATLHLSHLDLSRLQKVILQDC